MNKYNGIKNLIKFKSSYDQNIYLFELAIHFSVQNKFSFSFVLFSCCDLIFDIGYILIKNNIIDIIVNVSIFTKSSKIAQMYVASIHAIWLIIDTNVYEIQILFLWITLKLYNLLVIQ